MAALDPDATAGAYYLDCQVESVFVHPKAGDQALAKKLWEFTEEIVAAEKK